MMFLIIDVAADYLERCEYDSGLSSTDSHHLELLLSSRFIMEDSSQNPLNSFYDHM